MEKELEASNTVKRDLSKRVIQHSQHLIKLNKACIKFAGVSLFDSNVYSTYLKMLTACVGISEDNKRAIIEENRLSSILRVTAIIEDRGAMWQPILSENLKGFFLKLVEDDVLIEKTIMNEIMYVFYTWKQRFDTESSKGKSRDEGTPSNQKPEFSEEIPLTNFLEKFCEISAVHPTPFTNLLSKMCVINVKAVTDPNTFGLQPVLVEKLKKNSGKPIKVKYIKLTEPLATPISKKDLSENTRKATVMILTEIVVLYLKEFNNSIAENKDNKKQASELFIVSPKIAMDTFLGKVISKFPVLHLVTSRFDCAEVVQKLLANSPFKSLLLTEGKMYFLSFFVRIVLLLTPKAFGQFWAFLKDNHILTIQAKKLVPLNSVFRKELLGELKRLFSDVKISSGDQMGMMDERYEPSREELFMCLKLRSSSELLINVTQDVDTLKGLIGKQSCDNFETQISKCFLKFLENFGPQEMSKYRSMMDLIFDPLSLLYKYSVLFSVNKSAIETLSDSTLNESPKIKIAELVAPETLSTNWETHTKQLNGGDRMRDSKMTNPTLIMTQKDLEFVRREFRTNRITDIYSHDSRRGLNPATFFMRQERPLDISVGDYADQDVSGNEEEEMDYEEDQEYDPETEEEEEPENLRLVIDEEVQMEEEPGMLEEEPEEAAPEDQTGMDQETRPENPSIVPERRSPGKYQQNLPGWDSPMRVASVFLIDQNQEVFRDKLDKDYSAICRRFKNIQQTAPLLKSLELFESLMRIEVQEGPSSLGRAGERWALPWHSSGGDDDLTVENPLFMTMLEGLGGGGGIRLTSSETSVLCRT
jgi:hypothetical protein